MKVKTTVEEALGVVPVTKVENEEELGAENKQTVNLVAEFRQIKSCHRKYLCE